VAADALELTIHEGRKRQVKRMCEQVGHPVRRLERVKFGPLELGDLRPGAYRRLTEEEVEALANA
jgi:pseudouridine synthase